MRDRKLGRANGGVPERIGARGCGLGKGLLTIIVVGWAGSGNRTLLNALSCGSPDSDRILTSEEAAELYLNQRHVLRLESRQMPLFEKYCFR